MAIVPWGVLVDTDDTPRILRWAAVRTIEVADVARASPPRGPALSSRVAIATDRDRFVGEAVGAVLARASRRALRVRTRASRARRSRSTSTERSSARESIEAIEPGCEMLLGAARDWLETAAAVVQLGLAPAVYRTRRRARTHLARHRRARTRPARSDAEACRPSRVRRGRRRGDRMRRSSFPSWSRSRSAPIRSSRRSLVRPPGGSGRRVRRPARSTSSLLSCSNRRSRTRRARGVGTRPEPGSHPRALAARERGVRYSVTLGELSVRCGVTTSRRNATRNEWGRRSTAAGASTRCSAAARRLPSTPPRIATVTAALKIIHQSLCSDSALTQRFLREAGIANAIKHRAIVPIGDDGMTEDGCAYLVLELLEGETLDEMRRACVRVASRSRTSRRSPTS